MLPLSIYLGRRGIRVLNHRVVSLIHTPSLIKLKIHLPVRIGNSRRHYMGVILATSALPTVVRGELERYIDPYTSLFVMTTM